MKLLEPTPVTDDVSINADPLTPKQHGHDLVTLGVEEQGHVGGKPRFVINSNQVINDKSGFKEKHLCDGLTFTAGHACVFSCEFCYVEAMLNRNQRLNRIRESRGLAFEDMVVEIGNAPLKVRAFLLTRGKPRFDDPNDTRVIYGSPLVDVAATASQADVTVEICRAILELTQWQIRLLSKSSLLLRVAERLAGFKDRVIYGLSTGTLESDLASLFEKRTSPVSKRLEALRWLQANDYRTFGMICPILPQADYSKFAAEVAASIDIARCEHVWAEVLNQRGDSMKATSQALRAGGRAAEADRLDRVASDRTAWEEYARATFQALGEVVPADKLRFLQYVTTANRVWWEERHGQGAVLLGRKARAQADDYGHVAEQEEVP